MSLQTILKNIYSYLEVLQAAHTDSVKQWDEESLDHAFKWATYCEQIYKQSEGKPYQDDLDNQIRQLGKLPWAHGGITVHLDLLSQASKGLKQALLQNPYLSSQLFNLVMTSYTKMGSIGTEQLLEDIFPACEAKASLEAGQMLASVVGELQPAMALCSTSQAHILLNYIGSVLSKDHIKQKTEKLVHQKLLKVWERSSGKNIVLTALILPPEAHDPSLLETTTAAAGQNLILNWLLTTALSPEHTDTLHSTKTIWNVSKSLLCKVSSIHFKFFTEYIHYLVIWGKSLIPVYKEDQTKPLSVEWRCNDNLHTTSRSYQELASHWQALLASSSSHVSNATHKTLIALIKQSSHSVWKDILETAQKQSDSSPDQYVTQQNTKN